MKKVTVALGVLCFLSLTATSYGVVIFQEDFTGTNVALNGATPTVSMTGEVWEAGPAFLANGQVNSVVGSAIGNAAHLGFTPQPGIYTASAEIANANPDWIAFGFMGAEITAGDGTWTQTDYFVRHSNNGQGGNGQGAYAWVLTRSDAGQNDIQFFNGENTGGNFQNVNPLPTSTVQYDIVLDTTASPWTAAYYLNGVQQGATQDLPASAETEIGGIGFSRTSSGSDTGGGMINSFSLTYVPEPASILLLGFGGLALLRRR